MKCCIIEEIEEYEDILETEWPRETLRAKMPLKNRAKIFLPFSALRGLEESLDSVRMGQVE